MLFSIILTFVLVGLVLWLVNQYIPMDDKVRQLMNIAVIIVLAIWLVRELGLLSYLS